MVFTKDKKFYFDLKRLAVPMALGNLISFLITLTDSIVVGRLGDGATAAIFSGTLIATTLQMLIAGIEGGITLGISQYFGKGEREPIKRIFSLGVALILALGVLLFLPSFFMPGAITRSFGSASEEGARYLKLLSVSFPIYALSGGIGAALRGVESVRIVTFSSFLAFVVNLGFDILLVFGKLGFAKMGVLGAAAATLIARIIELSVLVLHLFFKDGKIKISPKELLKMNKGISRDFFKYTSPIILGQIIWIINTLFSSYVFASFRSDAVLTGLSVANTLNSLAYISINGLSGAVGIIVGKTVGEGRVEKLREYAYTTEVIFLFLGIITSLALILVRDPFASLYDISPEAMKIAKSLITVLAFTVIGTAYQLACLVGLVRGGGDTAFILKNDAVFIFLFVIPLTLIALKLGAPLPLILLALKSDQILKCLPAAIKINRFGWVKNVTREKK